jgi:hypothetical protein
MPIMLKPELPRDDFPIARAINVSRLQAKAICARHFLSSILQRPRSLWRVWG